MATHQPDGYDPLHRFVDQLTNQPLATVPGWRRTHHFAADTPTTTRVEDVVDTPIPALLLRSMFAYRHAQLADDLASHARARRWNPRPLTVAVTGASGLVGTAVCALLTTGGHRIVRLVRHATQAADRRRWQPTDPDPGLLAGLDAVIHLAGVPIAGRFTNAHKAAVVDSRVTPTPPAGRDRRHHRRAASVRVGLGDRLLRCRPAIQSVAALLTSLLVIARAVSVLR